MQRETNNPLPASAPCETRGEETVFFWLDDGENGWFSNWYPCRFTVDGIVYENTEQYFMAQKARLFGDTKTLALIMQAQTPAECKRLGRQVSPFDSAIWDAESYGVMKTGNRAKFLQTPALLEKLLATGNAALAEASPYDGIWGIRLSAEEARNTAPSAWPGRNLQGKLLTELREEFRAKGIE